jgi:hypothetical protein
MVTRVQKKIEQGKALLNVQTPIMPAELLLNRAAVALRAGGLCPPKTWTETGLGCPCGRDRRPCHCQAYLIIPAVVTSRGRLWHPDLLGATQAELQLRNGPQICRERFERSCVL